MNINRNKIGEYLTLELEGRLDTITAPLLEEELNASLNGVTKLVIDMQELDYISSAGLRVLLAAYKKIMKQGTMEICNVNDMIMEVFEVTGFDDILTIKR